MNGCICIGNPPNGGQNPGPGIIGVIGTQLSCSGATSAGASITGGGAGTTGASLIGASLIGASLIGTSLIGISFFGTSFISGRILAGLGGSCGCCTVIFCMFII
ncbi:pentapeptide repeat-containing protein [Neobacillus drentensis]|uniref:pentapeptide repeat-containing protein n=1 Tax=Neobacillus drentensis TaxID=220684 RepID=UPI003000ECCF